MKNDMNITDRPTLVIDVNITAELIEALRARGLVIVPIIPTPEMVEAGWASANDEDAALVWRDMIEYAPSPL